MKIYTSKLNESWIVDRLRNEWIKYNSNLNTSFISKADIIWLIAPWVWKKVNSKQLKEKKVVCTIHHLEDGDIKSEKAIEFYERDQYIDVYHVISKKTKLELSKHTDKPIKFIPFWTNNELFFEILDKETLRAALNIPKNAYVIGSFQRDTEGFDLKSPKLIKGPDRLINIFDEYNNRKENLIILLAGKRRQYIISELSRKNINYLYFEMVNISKLNQLYNCLDLYIVASRIEGGPQAIFECALTKTPIISTDVGIASEILNSKSIFKMDNFMEAEHDVDTAYANVTKYNIPQGFEEFYKLFQFIQ